MIIAARVEFGGGTLDMVRGLVLGEEKGFPKPYLRGIA